MTGVAKAASDAAGPDANLGPAPSLPMDRTLERNSRWYAHKLVRSGINCRGILLCE